MKVPNILKNKQLGRFTVVGLANTAIDFGVLLTLKSFGINVLVANTCSSTLAFIFSFAANKKYTFKTTDTNVVREMVLFVVVTLVGLWGLQNSIIALTQAPLINLLHNPIAGLVASKLLATLVSMVWNYIMYARVVFKHTPPIQTVL